MAEMSRVWAMPNSETFTVKPIGEFVKRYLVNAKISVDPFARNRDWATYTNDLNPNTSAQSHMDATDYLRKLADDGIHADLVIIDPPYSPRQVKECYDGIGIKMKQGDALLGAVRGKMREQIDRVLTGDGIVLWFGWNTNGMGKKYGFRPLEILMVAHGSDHNDTICMAEQRDPVWLCDRAAQRWDVPNGVPSDDLKWCALPNRHSGPCDYQRTNPA
jgi:hypothetical protein